MLLMGGGILVLMALGSTNRRATEAMNLFLIGIASVFLWIGWRVVNSKEPALQFGPEGIWTRKLGFQPWKQVSLEVAFVSGYKTVNQETLFIKKRKSRTVLDSISLSSLSSSTQQVKAALNQYKWH